MCQIPTQEDEMANSKHRPEHCTLPDCQSCPYDDCVYDRIEKVDKTFVCKHNLWVQYQHSCLTGNGRAFERSNPAVMANEKMTVCDWMR